MAVTSIATMLVPATGTAQNGHSIWRTPWEYEGQRGPAQWGNLDSQYVACTTGKAQSPIDIRDAKKVDLPALRFAYHSAPLEHLINNGKTIRVNYHAPGSGDYLTIGDARYQLTQFHFHHPSEEYIHGKPYDMVAHLMHEAADGTVVGVAVLLKAGAANPMVQQLWVHMPANIDYENDVPSVDIDPATLLPPSLSYYTYMGSGTAPPCAEGVKWIVLMTPVDVSREQIEAFAKLFPHDVRPTQPLNGRIVEESR